MNLKTREIIQALHEGKSVKNIMKELEISSNKLLRVTNM